MTSPSSTDEDLDAQAAQWLVRAMSAEVTDADIIALTCWLDVSADHLAAYERAETVWEMASRLSPTPIALAAIVNLADRRPAHVRRPRRAWMYGGLVAAGIVAAAMLLTPHGKPFAPAWQTYETATGERRTVTLSDGSRMQLNSGTLIRADLSGAQRRFELSRGEVALAVTHDAGRPLSLVAGDVVVRDIGTRFDVYKARDGVNVTVSEGQVAVASGATSADVTAGQKIKYGKAQGLGPTGSADLNAALAWQQGRAVYRDVPLSAVVDDLNRYVDKPLAVRGAMGELKVNAVLPLDSEAKIVEALEAFLPVRAVDIPGRIELRRR